MISAGGISKCRANASIIRAGDAYPRLAATIRAISAVDLCFEIVGDPVKRRSLEHGAL
jgi:hypothetical protein